MLNIRFRTEGKTWERYRVMSIVFQVDWTAGGFGYFWARHISPSDEPKNVEVFENYLLHTSVGETITMTYRGGILIQFEVTGKRLACSRNREKVEEEVLSIIAVRIHPFTTMKESDVEAFLRERSMETQRRKTR